MAHIVIPEESLVAPKKKKERKGIKELMGSQMEEKEERVEQARDRVQEERKKTREAEIAKRRLRMIAVGMTKQKSQTEQETIAHLDQINKMSPEEAFQALDLYLARADAGFADKLATSIRDGCGSVIDRLLRAKGCISARFHSDQALQSALASELTFVASFVSNKGVIALSAASDVIGGYQDSLLVEKDDKVNSEKELTFQKKKKTECVIGPPKVPLQN
jgi:hypothetical protein